MGELNLLPQDRRDYTAETIKTIAGGVVLASAVVAPNILQLLARQVSKNGDTEKALRSIRYAKSKGWLTFEDAPGGIKVALSENGRLKWTKLQLQEPLKDKKWDKKWRLVVFDIPVSQKANAEAFRQAIKRLGLKQLQKSIWITPYACQTHIAVLRQMHDLKEAVQVMEVCNVENEAPLKQLFSL